MPEVTRCKMLCTKKSEENWGRKVMSYEFAPQYSDDPNSENKKFWDASPGGKLELNCCNEIVDFEVGKEYYIDISKAPETIKES